MKIEEKVDEEKKREKEAVEFDEKVMWRTFIDLMAERKYAEAIPLINRLIDFYQIDQDHNLIYLERLYTLLAESQYRIGDCKKAKEAIDLAFRLAQYPDVTPLLWSVRGSVWWSLEKIDDAISDFGRSIEIAVRIQKNTSIATASWNRGLLLYDRKRDYKAAHADFMRAYHAYDRVKNAQDVIACLEKANICMCELAGEEFVRRCQ